MKKIDASIIIAFKNAIGEENVITDQDKLIFYATDHSIAQAVVPQLVVLPSTTEMVSEIMKI